MKDNIDIYTKKNAKSAHLEPWRIAVMVLGGLIVGFISGLFGGGGGIIIVPLLAVIGKLSEREAHATSIAIVFPIAIVCMVVYFLNGTTIDGMNSLYLTIGSLLGGLVGTFLLKKLSSNALRLVFYVIMLVAGAKMLIP